MDFHFINVTASVKMNQFKFQEVYSEALGLRDVTRGTLTRQELNAINDAKAREKELQDLRYVYIYRYMWDLVQPSIMRNLVSYHSSPLS